MEDENKYCEDHDRSEKLDGDLKSVREAYAEKYEPDERVVIRTVDLNEASSIWDVGYTVKTTGKRTLPPIQEFITSEETEDIKDLLNKWKTHLKEETGKTPISSEPMKMLVICHVGEQPNTSCLASNSIENFREKYDNVLKRLPESYGVIYSPTKGDTRIEILPIYTEV